MLELVIIVRLKELYFVCLSEVGNLKLELKFLLTQFGLLYLIFQLVSVWPFIWRILGYLGRVLAIDIPTSTLTMPNYARVCIELDLTKPRLEFENKGVIGSPLT